MNRSSIFFTVTLSFIISLMLVGVSYFLLTKESMKRYEFSLVRKYYPVVKDIKRNYIDNSLKENLKLLKYKLILNQDKINKILHDKNTRFLFEKKHDKNIPKEFREPPPKYRMTSFFTMLENGDKNYILTRKRGKNILILDLQNDKENFLIYLNLAFGVVFLVLIVSFILTLRKLYPIKTLQQKVKAFGDEDFSEFSELNDKKDEVSLLWNEFTKSAMKLKSVKEARNIFIRNIMHELKTPITKGRFLLELDGDKEKLQEIFYRLDTLINEFALVESLNSKTKEIKKDKIFLADIVENAQDLLLLDDKFLDYEFENIILHVNYKYFCIAIKNLIDNAIKYSPNKKATIKNDGENIIIENRSTPLPMPIENYKEPFGGIEEGNKKDSFGLGLYLTHNILKANDYKLEYLHVNGINRFTCRKKS